MLSAQDCSQQVPSIAKISKSSLQFRQLMDSLRKKEVSSFTLSNFNKSAVSSPANTDSLPLGSQKKSENEEEKLQCPKRTKLIRLDTKLIKAADMYQATKPLPFASPITVKQENGAEIPPLNAKQVKFACIVKQLPNAQQSVQLNRQKIKDVSEEVIIEYCQRETTLNEQSNPSEIFSFYEGLCSRVNVSLSAPYIKKYKNCVYFGFSVNSFEPYEGFIYFYDGTFYYGQFLNELKHGKGTEINWKDKSKFKGEFKEGKKSGNFLVSNSKETYIGRLQDGLFDGEGKLTTEEYTYEGYFRKGLKEGYGQERYPKTGVTFAGIFKAGKLCKRVESRSNSLSGVKSNLQTLRRKSFDKHNQRMRRMREKQGEYEFQLETGKHYGESPHTKIDFKKEKLKIYLQHRNKSSFPSICQEYSYSIDSSSKYDRISNRRSNPETDFEACNN